MIHQVYRNCFFKNPAQIVFTFHPHILENNNHVEEDDPQNLKKIAKIIKSFTWPHWSFEKKHSNMSKNPYSPSTNPFMAGGFMNPTRAGGCQCSPAIAKVHLHATPPTSDPKKGSSFARSLGVIQPVIPRGWTTCQFGIPPKKKALFVCGIYIPKNPLKAPWPKTTFFFCSFLCGE